MSRVGAPKLNMTFLLVLVLHVLLAVASACGSDAPPLIAVVVDDMGYSLDVAGQLSRMQIPLTWAIIPYQKSSLETAEMARSRGIPFMLHLPMEAKGKGDRQSIIRIGMTEEAVRLAVRNALWSLPGVSGLNNHTGARATESRTLMESVMKEAAAEGVFFIDSRTTPDSVAYQTALSMGVPASLNRSFLDHVDREDFMWSQFEKALSIAARRGGAVVICHARSGTLKFLPRLYQKASGDVRFVTVPEYLEQKRIGGWEE